MHNWRKNTSLLGGGPLLVKDGKNMCSDIHGSGEIKAPTIDRKTVSEHFKDDNKWYEWGNAKTTRMAMDIQILHKQF